MGGMGKTTSVRRDYEDANVKRRFHSHAWVTISQTFKIELILKNIIQQLYAEIKEQVPQEVESKDVDGLKEFLKDFLQERRCIIIFDDIWSIDAWEAFECVLPNCNCGSRVMLTTRIEDVALSSCNQHYGYLYRMKALSHEEAWTLFCNKTFEDKCCPSHLENISHKIPKKCEGLPLAIVSISGVLFRKDKTRLEEWEKVHCSLCGKIEGTGKLDQVKKGKLRQLKGLGITKLRREDGKQLCYSLEMLTNLRELEVVSKNEDEILDLQHSMSTIPQFLQRLLLDGRLEKVPPWVASLHGLRSLDLYNSRLAEDQLECLQLLPNLLQLSLIQAYEEENLCFKAEGYKKPELLVLTKLKQLRHVTIEEGGMPHLKRLEMTDCKLVEELPQGIQNLSELREVRLWEMRKELVAEMENGKTESENYRKIAHVPEILVGYWIDGKWESRYL